MFKKKFLLFIFLIFELFLYAEDFHYIAEKDVAVFFRDEDLILSLNNKKIIRKGTTVNLDCEKSRIRLTDKNKQNKLLSLVYDSNIYKGFISIKNLKIKDCNEVLPKSIISVEEIGISKKYVPSYFLEALKNNDTSIIKKYDHKYALENQNLDIQEETEEYIARALQEDRFYAVISNMGLRFHNDNSFLFNKIEKISDTVYRCTGYGVPSFSRDLIDETDWDSCFSYDQIDSNEYESLILKIDGDFIHIYSETQKKDLITYVKIFDDVEVQLINLFNHKDCNTENLNWPRHADGTCDYDGSKKAHTTTKPAAISSTQTTNIAPNKTMIVKENLKLRSGEATITSVLAVMSTGTKVKILALGKQATIDGITSNWVQVEVQAGAKDRDGKPIAAGTTGWCFGGYLE